MRRWCFYPPEVRAALEKWDKEREAQTTESLAAQLSGPVISVTPKGFTFQRCVVARVKQDDEAIGLYSLVDPGDTVLIAPRFFHKDCRVVALGGGWLICELPPSRTRDAITSTLQWLRSVLRVWRWY